MTEIKDKGVTLVELLVIISIIAILSVALGFSYRGWMGSYRVESELKQLYADIMNARMRAMTENRMHFVNLTATNYSIYEDTTDDTAFNPGAGATNDHPIAEFCVPSTFTVNPKTLQYNLGWTGNIGFDTKGLAWEYTSATARIAASRTISITLPPDTKPDYDCIIVSQARVRMGQMSGGACGYK